jgi:hypothetical protein
MNIDILNAYCGLLACPLSMPGSGSVKHPSQLILCIEFSRVVKTGVTLKCGRKLSFADSRGIHLSWVGFSAGFCCSEVREISFCLDLAPHKHFRPEIRQDYSPNLSILISEVKENNCDAPSNGE